MDAFIQKTLDALPQTLLGALITGVGIFLFQRWMDIRKQKTLLRDSAKFSINYQKRLEAVEDIHKKFNAFSSEFSKYLDRKNNIPNSTLFSQWEILSNSFADNFIYFSRREQLEIQEISYLTYTYILWGMRETSFVLGIEGINLINSGIKIVEANITPIDPQNPNMNLFHEELEEAILALRRRIVRLYQSILEMSGNKK